MDGRKLYRSRSDRLFFGVCGGLGKFFNIDPTIVRLIFVLLVLLAGHGVLIYLVLAIFMPPEPLSTVVPVPPTYNTSGSPQE